MLDRKKQTMNKHVAYFFMLFIVIQPILDILTNLSIRELNLDITVGIVVRLVSMGIGGLFLLYNFKLYAKWKVIYLTLLAGIIFLGLINNFFVKEPFSFMSEVQSIGKDVYSVVMLLLYLVVFSIIRKYEDLNKFFPLVIVSAAMLINVSMLIALMTGTSQDTYQYMKFGQKGWFYAGNELGTILAIIFPVITYYSIKLVTEIRKAGWWILTILSIFSLLIIGTKVGYGAVIIILPIASGAVAFEMIRNKKVTKVSIFNFVMPIVLMSVVVVITPYLSISSNTESHIELVEEFNRNIPVTEDPVYEEIIDDIPVEEVETQERDLLDELIYSGRTSFLRGYINDFNEAPLSQKLFGLGYGGNYESRPKLIERDFHDIFFQYGLIGSSLFLIPFFYYLINIGILAVKRLPAMFSVKYMMFASSIAIGLGVAFIAGHVLTAPGVSIYLVTIISFLHSELMRENHLKNKSIIDERG